VAVEAVLVDEEVVVEEEELQVDEGESVPVDVEAHEAAVEVPEVEQE
jgi:hypothetical protein